MAQGLVHIYIYNTHDIWQISLQRLSPQDIRWLLLETAEELSWTTGFIGNGMLDVNAAVAKALSGVRVP